MPCRVDPTPEEIAAGRRAAEERDAKAKKRWSDMEESFCWAMSKLEEYEPSLTTDGVPPTVKKLWKAHKDKDARRRAQQEAAERERKVRRNALSKLSAEERKVLGV